MEKMNIGIVGCGNISDVYFKNFSTMFSNTQVLACTDIMMEKAQASGEKYGIKKVYSFEDMLKDPEIDIVLNLTVPAAHFEVSMAVLNSGKHLYSEKPFTISAEEAKKIVETGIEKKLYVGCAPDTFMGAGLQTCKRLIMDGEIGRPIGATAFFHNHGIEDWHPNPFFHYKKGGGPMLDMAAYYLTALVNLISPIKRVTGMSSISFPERMVTNKIDYGKIIKVEVPTHASGLLEFDNGAVGTILISNDIWHTRIPYMEIYGEQGTMITPDPNFYKGPVLIRKPGYDTQWTERPLVSNYTENSRGLGVSDMINAIQEGRKNFRCDARMALHVMDVIDAMAKSAEQGVHINIDSRFEVPEVVAQGYKF